MPETVKGKIKVVGVLEGWPFPVKEDATEVDPKAMTGLGGFFKQLEKALVK